jgi:hypothetical protein
VYFPAWHGPHESTLVAPTDSENLPAGQSAHCVPSEYWPAAHGAQSPDDVAPAVLDLPAPQALHVASEPAAVAGEYLPTAHGSHVSAEVAAAAAENLPSAQARQAPFSTVSDGAREYLPAGQSLQATADAAENVPATQLAHAASSVCLVSAEDLPAAHGVQARSVSPAWDAALMYVPAGQSWHSDIEEAPDDATNLPAGQS